MRDTTIRLMFAGAVALGSLVAALAVVLTGMATDLETAAILALAATFGNGVTAGIVFFLGHQNGAKANGPRP